MIKVSFLLVTHLSFCGKQRKWFLNLQSGPYHMFSHYEPPFGSYAASVWGKKRRGFLPEVVFLPFASGAALVELWSTCDSNHLKFQRTLEALAQGSSIIYAQRKTPTQARAGNCWSGLLKLHTLVRTKTSLGGLDRGHKSRRSF